MSTTTTNRSLLASLLPDGQFPITAWQAHLIGAFASDPNRAAAFAHNAGGKCLMCSAVLLRGRWVPYTVDQKAVGICGDCVADFPGAVRHHRLACVREEFDFLYETGSPRARAAHARRLLARPPRATKTRAR